MPAPVSSHGDLDLNREGERKHAAQLEAHVDAKGVEINHQVDESLSDAASDVEVASGDLSDAYMDMDMDMDVELTEDIGTALASLRGGEGQGTSDSESQAAPLDVRQSKLIAEKKRLDLEAYIKGDGKGDDGGESMPHPSATPVQRRAAWLRRLLSRNGLFIGIGTGRDVLAMSLDAAMGRKGHPPGSHTAKSDGAQARLRASRAMAAAISSGLGGDEGMASAHARRFVSVEALTHNTGLRERLIRSRMPEVPATGLYAWGARRDARSSGQARKRVSGKGEDAMPVDVGDTGELSMPVVRNAAALWQAEPNALDPSAWSHAVLEPPPKIGVDVELLAPHRKRAVVAEATRLCTRLGANPDSVIS